jgi:hypothetical protein
LTAWDWQWRRAMTLLILVAALTRTNIVPLTIGLLVRLGWRPALTGLALVLLAITVPLHALVLRRRPEDLGLAPDGDVAHQLAHSLRHGPNALPRQGHRRFSRAVCDKLRVVSVTSSADPANGKSLHSMHHSEY